VYTRAVDLTQWRAKTDQFYLILKQPRRMFLLNIEFAESDCHLKALVNEQ